MAESFFARLECELIDRRSCKSKTDARLAVFTRIEERRKGQVTPEAEIVDQAGAYVPPVIWTAR